MIKGALIFAQNNASVDYIKMAIFSAKQVIKHLDIPVSLVTDATDFVDVDNVFDQVIRIEPVKTNQVKKFHDGTLSAKKLEWKNLSRHQAYNLTPYDKTLVIDSDYIINSPMLASAFDNDHEFQIYRKSFDLAGWRNTDEFARINQYSIPFYWATAFVFEKTAITRTFFELIEHIKDNWNYYRTLYAINNSAFRNDFAFSIAIHIMNGGIESDFAVPLPGGMAYIIDKDVLVNMVDNKMQFLVEKENYKGEYTLVKTTGIDVHVMNKYSLLRYINGGSGV